MESEMKVLLNLCEKIDAMASVVYRHFASQAKNQTLSSFWEEMSIEELDHVRGWQFLLDLNNHGALKDVFDDYEVMIDNLTNIQNRMTEYIARSREELSPKDQFLIACSMEIFMLDTAFVKLYGVLDVLTPTEQKLNYHAHLEKFRKNIEYFITDNELDLLVTNLFRLWDENIKLLATARTDFLTGLHNRRGFLDLSAPLLHLVSRGTGQSGLLMIDIDQFKLVNDSLGHPTGDRVLTILGGIIKGTVRHSDVCGRFGGEEFAVFLPSTPPERLGEIAEKIRLNVQNSTAMPVPITVSIGWSALSSVENVHSDLESLIAAADRNLYSAKQNGRNQVYGL